jgi:hypothetical protein
MTRRRTTRSTLIDVRAFLSQPLTNPLFDRRRRPVPFLRWRRWSSRNPFEFDDGTSNAGRVGRGEVMLAWEVDGALTTGSNTERHGDVVTGDGTVWEVKNPNWHQVRMSSRLAIGELIEAVMWRVVMADRAERLTSLERYSRFLRGSFSAPEIVGVIDRELFAPGRLVGPVDGIVLVDERIGFYAIPSWALDSELSFKGVSLYMPQYKFVGRGRSELQYRPKKR